MTTTSFHSNSARLLAPLAEHARRIRLNAVRMAAVQGQGYVAQALGIVDSNGLCVDGGVGDVMPMEPLVDKWRAFGWDTRRIDGHDFPALLQVLAPRRTSLGGPPRMVIADTVKGRGVSFMEGVRSWHADAITPELHATVLGELQEALR